MLDKIAEIIQTVREKTPLVQAVTNYVTINDCANILLCFGASPAMVEVREEMEEFVPIISALYINTGTLTKEQEEASLLAVKIAAEHNKPVVLDPVACGVLSRKMTFIQKLFELGKISVIKGNTGEIKALAGYSGKVRGVDSIDDGEGAVEACRQLAGKTGAVVVATGKTDIVTDGARTCLINNGTPLLTLITGAGCMAGALTAATAGVVSDPFIAGAAAITAMGLAGEMAAGSMEKALPGTFRVKLMDSIYSLTREDVLKCGKISCL